MPTPRLTRTVQIQCMIMATELGAKFSSLGESGMLGDVNCTLSSDLCPPGVTTDMVRVCRVVGSKRSISIKISCPGPPANHRTMKITLSCSQLLEENCTSISHQPCRCTTRIFFPLKATGIMPAQPPGCDVLSRHLPAQYW